jgi:hypothetical protein
MIGHLFQKQKTTYNGIYRGSVVLNDDPLKLGRVKIKVFGIMDSTDIPNASLPWAVPAMPLSNGAGSSSGSFYVPDVGTKVFLFFEEGNHMSPVYFAEAQDGVSGLPSFKDTHYPKRVGFKLSNGVQLYFDKQTNVVVFSHPAGAAVTIEADGSVVVSSPGDVTVQGRTITLNPS